MEELSDVVLEDSLSSQFTWLPRNMIHWIQQGVGIVGACQERHGRNLQGMVAG